MPRNSAVVKSESDTPKVVTEVDIPLSTRGELHWQFLQRDAFVKAQNITREAIERNPFRDLTITVTVK